MHRYFENLNTWLKLHNQSPKEGAVRRQKLTSDVSNRIKAEPGHRLYIFGTQFLSVDRETASKGRTTR